ncbi:MAG: tetraacyldisaccharide 4'-kinase [Cyclobacteriaceae bacterium]
MTWWQILLFPFALLLDLITRIRNRLFDKGIIKPVQFETNVIGIGNLSVGGTGKSPMVAYLCEWLISHSIPASTLSRGYKRKTKGFRIVTDEETAMTVGDEPYMFYQRYKEKVNVVVGEERMYAIPELLFHFPDTQVVLMDDAFQHRTVKPSLNIMITTFQRPFYNDFLMPSGFLRESRSGAGRADIIVVSKCPMYLSEADQRAISDQVAAYSDAKVFFTGIEYSNPVALFDERKLLTNQVIAISGIANADIFHTYVDDHYQVKIHHQYGDHHTYTRLDIKGIVAELNTQTSLITTEKDAVKMRLFPELKDYACYYLPIKIKFLKDETLFQSMIKDSIEFRQKEIS